MLSCLLLDILCYDMINLKWNVTDYIGLFEHLSQF